MSDRRERLRQLMAAVQAAETEAHALQLGTIGHVLNNAKKAVGWEIAGDVLHGTMNETSFAEKLRLMFGLTLGPWGTTSLAPNGQPYTVLHGYGHEQEAAEAFSAYRVSQSGDATVLYWRIQPEFSYRNNRHTYYMRLLIA